MNDKIFMSWLWHELKKKFPKQEDRQKILSAIETAKEKASLDKEVIC